MSTFKDKVRDLVKETRLSGNALGRKIRLPPGERASRIVLPKRID
ncbi:hypothetical protein ACFXGI_32925 [Streptomyces sp. NPDC059355]